METINNQSFINDSQGLLHEYFEKMALMMPDKVAIRSVKEELTYRELNDRATCLATLLRSFGVKNDCIVPVFMERNIDMYIALLAILKAGAAYLPIAVTCPKERVEFMLADSGAKLIITQQKYLDNLNDYNVQIISMESVRGKCIKNAETAIVSQDSLAYVIYTSGTTGKPKGVMIEHKAIVNRLLWMIEEFEISANDVFLQKTPYIFDVSVWELFLWTFVGGTLCILEHGYEKFPSAIIDAINRWDITIIHFIPSALNAFLTYADELKAVEKIKSLKQVFTSGESLLMPQAQKFKKILYDYYGVQLNNLYGPTEATIDVTFFRCFYDDMQSEIPIGKAIKNIELYILNDDKLVEKGEIGELAIGGICLARGYLNDKNKTDEKFVYIDSLPNVRLYRTGDLVRERSDGNIIFLGRMDTQIKIRGMRIELEEIECCILEIEKILECCVVVSNKETGILSAYIVVLSDIHETEIREKLKKKLPDYMIPKKYYFLDELPKNASGKIDRGKLE